MTTAPTTGRSAEIERYLDSVRSALRALPDETRDDLLDDLRHHLTEIAAEDPASLESRLGPADDYAAELRATVDAPPSADSPAARRVRRAQEWEKVRARVRPHLATADLRIGGLIGYERLGDFLALLRPAWWVLRGYAVALIFMTVFIGNQGLLPDLSGVGVLGWLFALALIGVSIRIGRHPLRLSVRARPLWLAAGAVLGAVMLIGVAAADDSGWPDSGSVPVYYDNDRTEVYPYDEHGKPLSGVRVYNRDGNPVPIGVPFGCEPTWPNWLGSRGCAPTPQPTSDPTATPPDGTTPTGGPAPSASGAPSPGLSGGTSVAPPSPSPSPSPSP